MTILVRDKLQCEDLHRVASESCTILRVPEFFPVKSAEALARRFEKSSKRAAYTNAPKIDRIGRALFEKQASEAARLDYEANSVKWIAELRKAASPISLPIDMLRLNLDEIWPTGATLATVEGCRTFCGLVRIFSAGAEAEPHMDVLSWDLPEGHLDGQLEAQLAANVYLKLPNAGGELNVWPIRLTREQYEEFRLPNSYGVHIDRLGVDPVVIRPAVGELIIFNSRCVHAVKPSPAESRLASSCFIGMQAQEGPLQVWS